ncbi:MAG: DEAD/DEAH box helicase [Elusimicrobia bacterium]|nr:DEAD/DEAH box helicase [Elusimicrobiota bacterium]
MIILHAGFLRDRLFVWGETPASKDNASRWRRAISSKGPKLLPFGAMPETLAAALRDAGIPVAVTREVRSRRGAGVARLRDRPSQFPILAAWLPTVAGIPLASSPLIAEPLEKSDASALAPWSVNAVLLQPVEAVNFLSACVSKRALAQGVLVGRDLAFWTSALAFSASLVVRQRMLPGLSSDNGRFRSCWKPVLTGPDAQVFQELVASLPGSARALSGIDAECPPETPPNSLLSAFVQEVVDHLTRSATPSVSTSSRGASLHDHWLRALKTLESRRLPGTEAELREFSEQVDRWKRPVTLRAASPFKLCFRLEEPESAKGEWQVRYLLQASNDPSLLLPAGSAWDGNGRTPKILRREDFKPREYLLSALGQAAGICPNIERSLRKAAPDGYGLDSGGAHEFLTARAAALEDAGFGVLLPAWWTRKGGKLQLKARAKASIPKMQGTSGLSLDDVIRLDWEMALGEETLTKEELEALAKLKEPLVRLRGRWVEASGDDIRAALAFWKHKGQATLRDLVRMSLGAGQAPGGLAILGVEAEGLLGQFLDRLQGKAHYENLPAPQKFSGELRPYQVRGFSWLAFLRQYGLGACLADDMGLGKTIQALALIQKDREAGADRPVLLVCPLSVVSNWKQEAQRFTPGLSFMVHHGLDRKKTAAFKRSAAKHAVVVTSYALLARDFETLRKIRWGGVILDEAQNVKNPQTNQARAARAIKADYRIALTGTPVENHVGELWSIMEFLNPGLLGSQTDFKSRFFIPIQFGGDKQAAERLSRITKPFVLRRLKTDKSIIRDLPNKLEMKVFCNLTKEQASLYAAVGREAQAAIDGADGIQRRGLILAALTKLKQICNHPSNFLGDNSRIEGRSGKLARLSEMLEEVLELGERALVFTQYSEMGHILKRHIEESFGREVLFLHGGVPKTQRDRMVERFQADGEGPVVFVLSLKAGGTGLNLTRANHVFHYDRWWNPAVEDQATDRAFRIGQTKDVQVHKFLCAGTLEEKIDAMIERKKEVAARVVGAGEGWLTELSNAELREVFALSAEAVED